MEFDFEAWTGRPFGISSAGWPGGALNLLIDTPCSQDVFVYFSELCPSSFLVIFIYIYIYIKGHFCVFFVYWSLMIHKCLTEAMKIVRVKI